MDAVSIHVPYKNLKQEPEVELAGLDEVHHHRVELDDKSRVFNGIYADLSSSSSPSHSFPKHTPLMTLIVSCTVAAGVEFGWALQLSLLTPDIQLFLTLCTLVTLYFAKVVPLTRRQSHLVSDSAPLLYNPQHI